jgi:hypothetical protein
MARQYQSDKDQHDDQTGCCVEKSLHVLITINRAAGLFHSTMPV